MKNPETIPLPEEGIEMGRLCRQCVKNLKAPNYQLVWESAVAEGQELSNEQG